jgi:hypothetical protein
MSTITELNPRLLALGEAGVSVWLEQIRHSMIEGGEQASGDLETLRAHALPAERVELEGDPADAVRSLTARITEIPQEG